MLYIAYRVKLLEKRSNLNFIEEYYMGSRSMGGFVLAMTIIASYVSASSFIGGPAIAYNIGAGFVPARKIGKLPGETARVEYDLEYGTNTIEVHNDAFEKGANVLIVDDLLATGGTAAAMVKLVEMLGANVYELAFLIELEDLNGRDLLDGHSVYSILKY